MDLGALDDQQVRDWPPAVVEHLHGWRLRATPGVRRWRSTSALPPRHGEVDHLDEVLERVAAFAREHNQVLGVHVHDGQDALDAELAARGGRLRMPTDVMTTRAGRLSGPAPGVTVGLDDAWLAVQADVDGRGDLDATVTQVFHRLGGRARHLQVPGSAVVLAVDSPGHVGVFALATRPSARGRGLGTALLRAAAQGDPDRTLYLQVEPTNPAVALYARLGLRRTTGYAYRTWGAVAGPPPPC